MRVTKQHALPSGPPAEPQMPKCSSKREPTCLMIRTPERQATLHFGGVWAANESAEPCMQLAALLCWSGCFQTFQLWPPAVFSLCEAFPACDCPNGRSFLSFHRCTSTGQLIPRCEPSASSVAGGRARELLCCSDAHARTPARRRRQPLSCCDLLRRHGGTAAGDCIMPAVHEKLSQQAALPPSAASTSCGRGWQLPPLRRSAFQQRFRASAVGESRGPPFK